MDDRWLIPLEQLLFADEGICRDQLYTHKAIVEPAYRAAIENILEDKEKARMQREAIQSNLPAVRKNRRP